MEALWLVLRYVHLVGFAVLFGGAVAQYLTGTLRVNSAMLWGSVVQLASGIALAAPVRPEDVDEPRPAKLLVKLVLAALIFVMVFFSRKRSQVNKGHFIATLALTLVTAAVGTFWR